MISWLKKSAIGKDEAMSVVKIRATRNIPGLRSGQEIVVNVDDPVWASHLSAGNVEVVEPASVAPVQEEEDLPVSDDIDDIPVHDLEDLSDDPVEVDDDEDEEEQ